jgi:hypothetical protein
MLAGGREDSPEVDQLGAVEMERRHGGPAGRGKADDERRVLIPREMFAPPLSARMEQRGGAPGRRIESLGMVIFMIITSPARQGQVAPGGVAATTSWADVFDGEGLQWRTAPGCGSIHSTRRRASGLLVADGRGRVAQPSDGVGMPRSSISARNGMPRRRASSARADSRSPSMRSDSAVSCKSS